jgi:hypothetical protein
VAGAGRACGPDLVGAGDREDGDEGRDELKLKWKRIADGLRRQIDDGTLKPGSWPPIGRIQREDR